MHMAPTTCPYARDAWAGALCRIYVRDNLDNLTHSKTTDPITDGEVGIYVCTDPAALSFDDFTRWLEDQNRNHFGVWLTGIHPDDPDIARIPGHDLLTDLIVVKMLALPPLAKAALRLSNDGFYADRTPLQLRPIVERGAVAAAWERALAHNYVAADDEAIQSYYDDRKH
jgi:hypothetical protein